jgi:hypothetical protein
MLDRLLDRGLGVRRADITQELTVLADQGDRLLVFALLRRRGFWMAHDRESRRSRYTQSMPFTLVV